MADIRQPSFWKQLVITAVCAGILLGVANSALWVNRNIFNTENFTNTATAALTSESSRRALASSITNQALQNRPVVNRIAGDDISNVIAGLLGSSQAESALTSVVSRLQVYVTSSSQESVVVNLEGIKSLMTRLIDTFGNPEDPRVDPDSIPNEITLIDADKIPNFYAFGVVFLWLGPIAFLGAVALIVYPYIRWRERYRDILLIQGAAITVAALLALLIGPLFKPPVLAPLTDPNPRTIISNLYDAFIAPFNNQSQVLVAIGIVMVVAGGVIYIVQLYRSRQSARG